MDLVIILFKTFVFYIVIIILYRVMGKREVSELKVVDLVVSMFIANIVAVGIENYKNNILFVIAPVVLLVFMQVVLSKLSFKYANVRKLVDGEPSIIVNRGRINFEEMLRQRYNLDDLLMELRSQGINSIEKVDFAILEVSGRLSVFLKEDNNEYPLPVILDGKVEEEALVQLEKDNDWLMRMIEKEGYSLKDVYYAFYRNKELFLIKNQNN